MTVYVRTHHDEASDFQVDIIQDCGEFYDVKIEGFHRTNPDENGDDHEATTT